MRGRVLVVAGSDSGGGAGVQADIKTITILGGYAATAVTALTAQNSLGVHGVYDVPSAFVAQQMDVVLSDLGADAVKTGMLPTPAIIEVVAAVLSKQVVRPFVVIDPVMVAKGGASLMNDEARTILLDALVPLATVITPNVPEAEALTDRAIGSESDMVDAARALLDRGAAAVLVKGGHLATPDVIDVLVSRGEAQPFVVRHARIATRHTHGTGCTLASAIATGLARGLDLRTSVERGIDYVAKAIEAAPGLGAGHGPIEHAWPLRKLADV